MIWIPGATFTMGGEVASFMKSWPVSARSRPDERPVHPVELDGFWMSRTPVTNAEFREFIEKTGYITTAEKAPELEEIMKGLPPGAAPPAAELLVPASMVFTPPKRGSIIAKCIAVVAVAGGRELASSRRAGKFHYKSNGSSSGASLIL